MTEENNDATTEDHSSDHGDETPSKETDSKEETSPSKETDTEPKHETDAAASEDKGDKDVQTESKDRDADKDGESKSRTEVKRPRQKGPVKIKVVRKEKAATLEPAKVTHVKVKDNRLAPVVKGRQKTHANITNKDGEVQSVETFGRRVMKKYWF